MKWVRSNNGYYPVVNGQIYFGLGLFEDCVSASIVAEEMEYEIKRLDKVDKKERKE